MVLFFPYWGSFTGGLIKGWGSNPEIFFRCQNGVGPNFLGMGKKRLYSPLENIRVFPKGGYKGPKYFKRGGYLGGEDIKGGLIFIIKRKFFFRGK